MRCAAYTYAPTPEHTHAPHRTAKPAFQTPGWFGTLPAHGLRTRLFAARLLPTTIRTAFSTILRLVHFHTHGAATAPAYAYAPHLTCNATHFYPAYSRTHMHTTCSTPPRRAIRPCHRHGCCRIYRPTHACGTQDLPVPAFCPLPLRTAILPRHRAYYLHYILLHTFLFYAHFSSTLCMPFGALHATPHAHAHYACRASDAAFAPLITVYTIRTLRCSDILRLPRRFSTRNRIVHRWRSHSLF